MAAPKRDKSFDICEPKYALTLIVVLGLIVRGIIALEQSAVLWPDSEAYYRLALRIAVQGDFSDYPIFRTPLYPAFLSLFFQFGESPEVGRAIIVTQQLLGLLTAVFFYLSALRWGSKSAALGSALLFCLYPLQIYYEVVIQAEVLFGFFLSIIIYYSTLFLQRDNTRLAVVVGFLLGIASLTRPTAQFISLCLLGAYFCSHRSIGRTLQRGMLIFFVTALAIFPWAYWNKIHKNYWGLSREVGLNMYHRIIDADRLAPDAADIPPDVIKVYKKTQERARMSYFTVWYYLLRTGHTEVEADALMTKTAFAAVRAHPLSYLQNTADIFMRFFLASRNSIGICEVPDHVVLCSGRQVRPALAFPRNFDTGYTFSHDFIKLYFSTLSLPMGVMNFIALAWALSYLWFGRARKTEFLFLLLLVLYFSSLTAIFNREEDRFRLPIDPILIYFFVDGVFHFYRWSAKRLTHAAPTELH